MIKEILSKTSTLMEKTISKMKSEFSTIHAGRIDISMLDNINVRYYDSELPLKQVAAITSPEARVIDIKPWDKNILSAIEKSIFSSSLGLTPINDGNKIRLKIPPMTEERKKEIIKKLHSMAETYKISLRNERETALKEIRKLETDKKISKDEKFRGENDLQKLYESYVKKIDEILSAKEKEIQTV